MTDATALDLPQENAAGTPAERHLVIEPGRLDRNYWSDLWAYRELFIVLAWRDVAVRYKQAALGAAWAVVRPLLAVFVFTIIFGRVAQLPSEPGVPYPVMVYAGMLPWMLISTILGDASNSLVSNAGMIGKIYYPRIITPAASSIVSLVDFAVSFAVFLLLMLAFLYVPSWKILFLPVFIVYAVAMALGPALYLASLNVRYRDFRFIVPFVVQFGLYISPVGFSSEVVPEGWRLLYSLNPAVSAIDGFRWCILGGEIWWPGFLLGLGVTGLMLWAGIRTFRRTERQFADYI
ncbi:ABC transporter permease [Roseitranquillus sediminis]|uniref:ABC transporter permease n=1 Tax=Roseitranquillus sediminis TaxID=2809051 RepID=UPI001D0C3355|nr:ABC transporter permease [Roseitranquillus sediminis]MBM9594003.1 ABC transporter permease [Roseitranquillus sediminis]